jgi:hypothetical protein
MHLFLYAQLYRHLYGRLSWARATGSRRTRSAWITWLPATGGRAKEQHPTKTK